MNAPIVRAEPKTSDIGRLHDCCHLTYDDKPENPLCGTPLRLKRWCANDNHNCRVCPVCAQLAAWEEWS